MSDDDYAEYVRQTGMGDGGASFYDRTPARHDADGAPLDQRDVDRYYGRCPDCGDPEGRCRCDAPPDEEEPARPLTADQQAAQDDLPF